MTRVHRAIAALLGALLTAGFVWASAPPAHAVVLGRVSVDGRHYDIGDVSLLTKLLRNPYLTVAVAGLKACGGGAYALVDRADRGSAALVAWGPATVNACLDTSAGGPGDSAGCLHYGRSPRANNPLGLPGASSARYHYLIAATSAQACQDSSTQVRGGVWAQLLDPSRTTVIVTCQTLRGRDIYDLVVAPRTRFPGDRRTALVPDAEVDTGGQSWLAGVPSCT